jgi:hypothetical protein
MAISFLTPKIMRAEVTSGIDIEQGIFLSGDRVTIGSGAQDDLQLGASDIAEEHLAFAYDSASKKWEYFASDRGATAVDKGNQRTGRVRTGMWFVLGQDTKLEIKSVPRPPELSEAPEQSGANSEIPLTIALPIMGLLTLAALAVVFGFGGNQSDGPQLRTLAWYSGQADIGPALDQCLETGRQQAAENGTTVVPASSPDALFRAYVAQAESNPQAATEYRDQLMRETRQIIAQAHIKAGSERYLESSSELRRLRNVLPVGLGNCPILSAARHDLALWEVIAGN